MQGFFFETFDGSCVPQIMKEVFIDGVYWPFLEGKKDLTIVDAGANVGLASFYFSHFAKRVISIEPAAQHVACIRKMIEFNNIGNMECYPYALAAQDGTCRFYHCSNHTMFAMDNVIHNECIAPAVRGQMNGVWTSYEDVQTRTLATAVKQLEIDKIDFMKLDIEGAESDLIQSPGFQSVVGRIGMIVGEWHAWTSLSRENFADLFRCMGFHFQWLDNAGARCFCAVR